MAGVGNRFVIPAGRRHQFAGGREGGRVAQSADPRPRSTVHKVRRGKGEVRGGEGKEGGHFCASSPAEERWVDFST